MNKPLIAVLLTTVCFLSQAKEVDMQAFKQQMQKLTQTGPEHAALTSLLGDWDVTFEMVMPGAPKQVSQGSATVEWVIPGRWVGQRLTGKLFGNSYESYSLHGYDSYAKNYVTTTVSSMDNAMNTTRGLKVDDDDSVKVEYGVLNEYLTGELNKPYKTVTKLESDDKMTVELWDLSIGEKGAIVIISHYQRKP